MTYEEYMPKLGSTPIECTHVTYNGGQGCTCSATHERWTQALAVEKDAHREMSAVAAERTAEVLRYSAALERIIFMAKGAATGSPLWYCYVEADKAITEATHD